MHALVIQKIIRGSVGTTASDVALNYNSFIIRNTHATQALFIKEKGADSVNVSSANGFTIPAGECFNMVLCADKLSVIGSGAATTYDIMIVDI